MEMSLTKKGGELRELTDICTELGEKNDPINNPPSVVKAKKGKEGILLNSFKNV